MTSNVNSSGRRTLEQIGVFAQYFVDRCVYVGQFPNGEIGRPSIQRGLRLQALVLGCVIDLLRDAWAHKRPDANVLSVTNTDTGLKAEIKGVQTRRLRSPGTLLLKALAEEWRIRSGILTFEISGAALERMQRAFDLDL